MQQEQKEKVYQVIDQVRPYLQKDGGDCQVVDIDMEKDIVYLTLHGACRTCPSALMTLKMGIESHLQENVDPNITVERVQAQEQE
jgi:Fe-S cluster biogenesis protein NfuA